MINIICPKCNNTVVVDEKVTSCFCTYCGSAMHVVAGTPKGTNNTMAVDYLEKGLLCAGAGLEEDAKRAFVTGLSLEPDNIALITAVTIYCGGEMYAKKLFSKNKTISKEETSIVERFRETFPHLIETRLFETCYYYKEFDRCTYIVKKYPELFTEENLLSRSSFLKDKDYVKLLISFGFSINKIFERYINKSPVLSAGRLGVELEESRLPLDIFEMYLDLGLDVNYKLVIEETYTEWDDGYQVITEEVNAEMDFYTFFETFESPQIRTEKDYLGNDVIISSKTRETWDSGRRVCGSVEYRFKYKNNTPRDYMSALLNHGYTPKPKPQPQKPKRRFPWF